MTTRARPRLGELVHYVSYGTPKGEFTSQCRAAYVTEKPDEDTYEGREGALGLAVLNPTGLFYHPLAMGGVREHQRPEGHVTDSIKAQRVPGNEGDHWTPEEGQEAGERVPYDFPGGTWHWDCGA